MLLLGAIAQSASHRTGLKSPVGPTTYYLDCSAKAAGDGTEAHPWNSLADANSRTLGQGDKLLLRRGTLCRGTLNPQGSGGSNAPITVDAYGIGPMPIVNGSRNEEAVKLFNQQYWEIKDIEVVGGDLYGVFITGDRPDSMLSHIHLLNLNVHGATHVSTKRSDSGEVVISTTGLHEVLNDVMVDGVRAHDTTASEGVMVSAGGAWTGDAGAPQSLGADVTVQNSTAYNVYGDGIMIAEVNNGRLLNNVVYRSGLCPHCTGSTPNGLWEWYCHSCIVEHNESYENRSWAKTDGGDFDIDYYDDRNIVQYNYGHDSAGYCISVFGSDGMASVDNIVRYNVCSNDGRSSAGAFQGEIFVYTWNGGSLNGVQIYNNTLYWNPAVNAPAFNTKGTTYTGTRPTLFANNIIYSTVPQMIQTTSDFLLDHNIYWPTSAAPATWQIGSKTYGDFSAYQAASQEDVHSFVKDPMLNDPTYHATGRSSSAFTLLSGSPAVGAGANVCGGIDECTMGTRDFFGNPLPMRAGAYDIGAEQRP
ncbi:MAG: hypothetical protein ACRD8A_00095 [Candidatus Acidiferrales bacterium]